MHSGTVVKWSRHQHFKLGSLGLIFTRVILALIVKLDNNRLVSISLWFKSAREIFLNSRGGKRRTGLYEQQKTTTWL